jgi:hypothetical protein
MKIIAIAQLTIHVYLLFCAGGLPLPARELASSELNFEVFHEWASAYVSSSRNDTQAPERLERPLPFSEKSCRLLSGFFSSQQIAGYHRNNDLDFNLPLICYKFPLAEHSEEG